MALDSSNLNIRRLSGVLIAFALMAFFLIIVVFDHNYHRLWTFDGQVTSALFYALLVTGITLWSCYADYRCTDRVIKIGIRVISITACFWLVDQLIKHEFSYGYLEAACWYLYYVALLLMPLSCFIMGIHTLRPTETKGTRHMRATAEVITAALLLLVLTNNFHYQVFIIDLNSPNYPDDYTYGIGFILVYAWIAVMLISFIVCMFIAARRNLRRAIFLIAAPIVLCLLYSLAYNMRVPIISGTNFTILFIMVAICELEVCLQLRLLPNMKIDEDAFRSLPFDLTIIDNNDNIAFRTDAATSESQIAIPAAAKKELQQNGMVVIRKDDTSFQINKLHGGYSVFAQDISTVNHQIQQLENQHQTLRNQSRLLTNQNEIERKLGAQNKKEELYEDIESSLSDAVNQIKSLLDSLPNDDTPEHHELRKRQLMTIKLLTAYCKRKGRLVVSSREDPSFLGERLQLALSETASDMNSIGITCGTLVEVDRPLDIKAVSNFYDRFYDIAHLALRLEEPTMMLHIGNTETEFQLRIILEDESLEGQSLDESEVDKLKTDLAAQGVQYDLQLDGDLLILHTFIKFEETAGEEPSMLQPEMGGAR